MTTISVAETEHALDLLSNGVSDEMTAKRSAWASSGVLSALEMHRLTEAGLFGREKSTQMNGRTISDIWKSCIRIFTRKSTPLEADIFECRGSRASTIENTNLVSVAQG